MSEQIHNGDSSATSALHLGGRDAKTVNIPVSDFKTHLFTSQYTVCSKNTKPMQIIFLSEHVPRKYPDNIALHFMPKKPQVEKVVLN